MMISIILSFILGLLVGAWLQARHSRARIEALRDRCNNVSGVDGGLEHWIAYDKALGRLGGGSKFYWEKK